MMVMMMVMVMVMMMVMMMIDQLPGHATTQNDTTATITTTTSSSSPISPGTGRARSRSVSPQPGLGSSSVTNVAMRNNEESNADDPKRNAMSHHKPNMAPLLAHTDSTPGMTSNKGRVSTTHHACLSE
jgi:hypothetical protein